MLFAMMAAAGSRAGDIVICRDLGRPRDRVFGWFSDHHCPDLEDAPPARRGRITGRKSFQL